MTLLTTLPVCATRVKNEDEMNSSLAIVLYKPENQPVDSFTLSLSCSHGTSFNSTMVHFAFIFKLPLKRNRLWKVDTFSMRNKATISRQWLLVVNVGTLFKDVVKF